MMRILCLIATEDRLWNMKRAFRRVEAACPGLMEGRFWSVWDLCAHPERIPAMLSDGEGCDFGLIYFHGGAQSLPNFHLIWQQLSQRFPIYFESSPPEEVGELLPRSGLNEGQYQAIRQYFRHADEENLSSMLLHIAMTHSGVACTVPEPVPPVEEGFYLPGGILSDAEVEALRRETARVVRSKVLNPKWLEGLKQHGFKGAQEISAALDSLFGWDSTAQVAEDWMYQAFAEKFLFDEQTRQWMEEVNKWAVHSASERLLETHQRGMWQTDAQALRQLQNIYMRSEGTIEEASL